MKDLFDLLEKCVSMAEGTNYGVQAEIFVLVPPGSAVKELDRRKELLKRHVQRVKLTSDPFTEQPDVLQLHNIRSVLRDRTTYLAALIVLVGSISTPRDLFRQHLQS